MTPGYLLSKEEFEAINRKEVQLTEVQLQGQGQGMPFGDLSTPEASTPARERSKRTESSSRQINNQLEDLEDEEMWEDADGGEEPGKGSNESARTEQGFPLSDSQKQQSFPMDF